MLFLNMKKTVLILVLLGVFALVWQCNKNSVNQPLSEDLPQIRQGILKNNDDFRTRIESLLKKAENSSVAQKEIISDFDALRISYKKMEWAVEYFMPHSARFINGPALPEIEFAEHIELEPQGLQVLEEQIYGDYQENRPEIIRQLKLLLGKSGNIKTNFETITVNRSQVMDALRQQIFRMSSLSVAGFDTPVSGRALKELPGTLETLKHVFAELSHNKKSVEKINSEIDKAKSFLAKTQDPLLFDYAEFLSGNLNALSAAAYDFSVAEQIPAVQVTTALRKTARTFYDKNAFDADAFVPGTQFKISNEKVKLGSQLFYDPVLSQNNSRSCASCHNPDKAFTDGLPQSMSLKDNPLHRNTPSLNYAAFQHGQFWDMRSEDLEGQSSDVITNKDEMHGNLDEILLKIEKNPEYKKQFSAIYKSAKIEKWQLQNALASYIRSLPKFSSRFDEFMRGNKSALSADEKDGFNLFVGKAKCATCHFVPLFNGTVPPVYTKTEQEVLGTATDDSNRKLDPDPGRGFFHETVAFLQHSFKTPTLRNISKTAPYMHNGGYKTLQDVMHFYNKGGGKGFGFKIDNQTLPPDELRLSQKEIDKIILFVNSLEDR